MDKVQDVSVGDTVVRNRFLPQKTMIQGILLISFSFLAPMMTLRTASVV